MPGKCTFFVPCIFVCGNLRVGPLYFLEGNNGKDVSNFTPPMSAIELSDLTIEDLLPHRGAMLLIDQVLEVDTLHAVTLSIVRETWPMADREGVAPLILVELAAQTAGVCNGWGRIQTRGLDSDQMGWLVAIKRADFFIEHLPFGSTVKAGAANIFVFENFREISSQLYHNDLLIAEVVLQLYQA